MTSTNTNEQSVSAKIRLWYLGIFTTPAAHVSALVYEPVADSRSQINSVHLCPESKAVMTSKLHSRASVSYPQSCWCIHSWRRVVSVAVADRLYHKLRNYIMECWIDILMKHKIFTYRMCLNSNYKLWGLVMGIKTVRFSIGIHVQNHIASPLQRKYHHITCWTLPLLLLTVRCCFSSGTTYKKG